MLDPIKSALVSTLSPDALYWLRSVTRAIMSKPPLAWPYDKDGKFKEIVHPADDGRPIQDIAMERYKLRELPSPDSYYTYEDVLIVAAQEISKILTLCVQYINGSHVYGDIAEFGTMGGFTAKALATSMVFDYHRQPLSKTASGENPFRVLRLFDSFEGLPEITSTADQTSPHVISGAWAKGSCKVLAAPELGQRIGAIIPEHRFEIYEGWFADTVKTLPPETRFSLIHFDGDLYQSAIDALQPLFARGMISTGAVLLFDDWNANRALPTTGERLAWKELVAEFDIEASDCGDYSVAGKRFIIHSYRDIPAEPE